MHELMKCEIWWVSKFCCLSFFFFLLCSNDSSVTVRSGKRQANLVDTWAFVTETTVIRREKCLFQSVLLLLGDWFGFRLVPLPAAIHSSDETCIVDQTGVQC